jgi:hypothetical protein
MNTKCETCGNSYLIPLKIVVGNQEHVFDCFECAIHLLAPRCFNCGVSVIGHGVEVDRAIYCSAHCGRSRGEQGLCDHSELEHFDFRFSPSRVYS